MNKAFQSPSSVDSLQERYLAFPDISYQEFLTLPEDLRREIIQKNRILQTDTYNRTMCHLKGPEQAETPETYVLQFRRASTGYLIAHGIRSQIERIARIRISQHELDFAKEFYRTANVTHFNEEMWQRIIDENDGYLPLNVEAVEDGTAVLVGDPILRVSGPGEVAAHFEPDIHRIFYETLVATTAHEIDRKIGAHRFIEVGKRGTPNELMHLQAASAMYAGGNIRFTSNDAAAACYPYLKDVGTLGHRFIQFFDTEKEAFRKAVEESDATSLLIDLTDSYRGIQMALDLKTEYRKSGKKIWIRLDSGDIREQAEFTLKKFQELGFDNPALDKVVIEDISTVDDMVAIDDYLKSRGLDPERFVVYGAGGLLVTKDKARSNASSGLKLAQVQTPEGPIAKVKFSDSPGKESLPGEPVLGEIDGRRTILQDSELSSNSGFTSLMSPVLVNGRLARSEDPVGVRARVTESFHRVESQVGTKSNHSELTRDLIQGLRSHYQLTN